MCVCRRISNFSSDLPSVSQRNGSNVSEERPFASTPLTIMAAKLLSLAFSLFIYNGQCKLDVFAFLVRQNNKKEKEDWWRGDERFALKQVIKREFKRYFGMLISGSRITNMADG